MSADALNRDVHSGAYCMSIQATGRDHMAIMEDATTNLSPSRRCHLHLSSLSDIL
jgi:hypothetical protein